MDTSTKKPTNKPPTKPTRRPTKKPTLANRLLPKSVRQTKWTLSRVVTAVVSLVIILYLGRLLVFGGPGKQAVDTTGDGGQGVQTQQPKAPRTVEFQGGKIRAEGGPVAVLNPGLARPGARVGVNASGFDAGASVEVVLSSGQSKPSRVATAKADKEGTVKTEFTFPVAPGGSGGAQTVTVQQPSTDKVAKADMIAQAGVGSATLSDDVAAPGSSLTVDADGFAPEEKVNVFWGGIGGRPAATLQADEHGGISKKGIDVGVGPMGKTSVILVGDKSKVTAVAPFTMLGLYPGAAAKPYAAKAGGTISITGKGFAPNEDVAIYFDQAAGPPAMTMKSDRRGGVSGESFKVPFGLKGKHQMILVGQQSRASVNTGFMALPYSPVVRASTYGGLPGTVLNFYARDFAPGEAVHVYSGRGKGSAGELVAAFRVDDKGRAAAAGKYVIPGDAQGKLTFTLVGAKSEGSGAATVSVEKPDGPVNVPPQPKYQLPPDLKE